MVNFAIQLDFDDLSTSIINVRTDDEAFLPSLYAMTNCDDVSWCNVIFAGDGGRRRHVGLRNAKVGDHWPWEEFQLEVEDRANEE